MFDGVLGVYCSVSIYFANTTTESNAPAFREENAASFAERVAHKLDDAFSSLFLGNFFDFGQLFGGK